MKTIEQRFYEMGVVPYMEMAISLRMYNKYAR